MAHAPTLSNHCPAQQVLHAAHTHAHHYHHDHYQHGSANKEKTGTKTGPRGRPGHTPSQEHMCVCATSCRAGHGKKRIRSSYTGAWRVADGANRTCAQHWGGQHCPGARQGARCMPANCSQVAASDSPGWLPPLRAAARYPSPATPFAALCSLGDGAPLACPPPLLPGCAAPAAAAGAPPLLPGTTGCRDPPQGGQPPDLCHPLESVCPHETSAVRNACTSVGSRTVYLAAVDSFTLVLTSTPKPAAGQGEHRQEGQLEDHSMCARPPRHVICHGLPRTVAQHAELGHATARPSPTPLSSPVQHSTTHTSAAPTLPRVAQRAECVLVGVVVPNVQRHHVGLALEAQHRQQVLQRRALVPVHLQVWRRGWERGEKEGKDG